MHVRIYRFVAADNMKIDTELMKKQKKIFGKYDSKRESLKRLLSKIEGKKWRYHGMRVEEKMKECSCVENRSNNNLFKIVRSASLFR